MRHRWPIECLWNGQPAKEDEHVELRFALGLHGLVMTVDAPYHGDPAPTGPPGPLDGLWEYEVVELFLLAEPDHYLEIELGPHGHHWVLELEGRRRIVRAGLPILFDAQIDGTRWVGHAEVPIDHLPRKIARGNGYAIHGLGAERRYLAHFPVAGAAPDFHRLECFRPLQ